MIHVVERRKIQGDARSSSNSRKFEVYWGIGIGNCRQVGQKNRSTLVDTDRFLMWPRFCVVQSRKTWRQVRQHGRDKGGKRAMARELYFRWIHWTKSILNNFLIRFLSSYIFVFFLLIRLKNYFISTDILFEIDEPLNEVLISWIFVTLYFNLFKIKI